MFTKFPPTPASYTLSLHDALPILTTWKKVSPTRKRWRARHTLSGSEPPEGTRDQRRRSRVMERERARAMPELANEDSRGYLDRPAVAAGAAPILVDSVARRGEKCPRANSRNGIAICAVYAEIGREPTP